MWDSGFAAAEAVVRKLWRPLLGHGGDSRPDAKTALRNMHQSQRRGLPEIPETGRSGTGPRAKALRCSAVNGLKPAIGEDRRCKKAQQAAGGKRLLVREGVWTKESELA